MVNLLAVLVVIIANMVLGSLWYGPLFGKPWMRLMGLKAADVKKMKSEQGKAAGRKAMIGMIVVSVIWALVLAWILELAGAPDAKAGALWGALLWLGLVATNSFNSVLFENKPFKLWLLNNGYNLLSLVIAGAILGAW